MTQVLDERVVEGLADISGMKPCPRCHRHSLVPVFEEPKQYCIDCHGVFLSRSRWGNYLYRLRLRLRSR